MNTIGVSCFYHDSAVAAVQDGKILFAIQEERLSRQKHDARFPVHALQAALLYCGWRWSDVDQIVFHETPWYKADRMMHQARMGWPRSWRFWHDQIPYHRWHKNGIEEPLRALGYEGSVLDAAHHCSHAAASFFTSPFDEALVLVADGVGEWDTLTLWCGRGNKLERIKGLKFPHSLGLFYSAMTAYLGFRPNNGEYKVMGLAAYGCPTPLIHRLLDNVLLLQPNGSFYLDQQYFDWCDPRCHYMPALARLLRNVGPRRPDEEIGKRHMDLAAAVQVAFETALIHVLDHALEETGLTNLCMAGGTALNCVASSKILRFFPGINLWTMPAAGDAGCALGAAILGEMLYRRRPGQWDGGRPLSAPHRYWRSPYLGTTYPMHIVRECVQYYDKKTVSANDIAHRLVAGQIVAVYQGRDEWGNRALGNRTILADPRRARMKDHVNEQIKFREPFRPFAPVVMEKHAGEWFERFPNAAGMSDHMMLTHKALRPDEVPAVVHVNGQSRMQTVALHQNPLLYEILREFQQLTGVPCLLNTSFNLRGEPIVSSPADAMSTFERSGIDCLVFGRSFLIEKEDNHVDRLRRAVLGDH